MASIVYADPQKKTHLTTSGGVMRLQQKRASNAHADPQKKNSFHEFRGGHEIFPKHGKGEFVDFSTISRKYFKKLSKE